MWKLQNFIQILREIKVDQCRVSKSAILAHLEALNSVFFYGSVSFLKTEIYQKLLIKVSEMAKMVFLDIFGSQKLISRKI